MSSLPRLTVVGLILPGKAIYGLGSTLGLVGLAFNNILRKCQIEQLVVSHVRVKDI